MSDEYERIRSSRAKAQEYAANCSPVPIRYMSRIDDYDWLIDEVGILRARLQDAEATLKDMPHFCYSHHHLRCGGCVASAYFEKWEKK